VLTNWDADGLPFHADADVGSCPPHVPARS
jgi:hypothetical protein